MRLAAKIMLVFFVVVMVMTALGSYFTVRRGFERFKQRQRDITAETAEAAHERLAEAWRKEGLEGVLEEAESLSPHDSQRRIRWVWFERTRFAANNAETTVIEHLHIGAGEAVCKVVTNKNDKRHLHTYCPIDLGEGPRGGLEVTASMEPLDEQARETIVVSLASLAATAAVSFALVCFVGLHWIARPLDRLIAKTKRVGEGDFSGPLSVGGNDELSQLARALNQMSDKLAEQQQQIQQETAARLATLEQLRHADRLKTVGRLAAGIAHELGTPLNVVSGRARLIASGNLSQEEIAQSAGAIKSEADRITGIVRQLLDFARRDTPNHSQLDVLEMIRQIQTLLTPLADKRRVDFAFEAAEESILVEVDAGQIQQVLTNIMVNAIHAMPDGGVVTVRAEVETTRPPETNGDTAARAEGAEGEYVAISIHDEGQGIAAEDLPHIFEPFFTTKKVGEGTGLGLSIAHGIVEEHGGWIEAVSEVGEGSRFTVYLPRRS